MFDIVSFIPRAIVQGIPLLLGSTGETLTEKSGNLNLGIPGIMYVGGISGVIGSFYYEQAAGSGFNPTLGVLIPLVCCLLGSLLMGLLYDQALRQLAALHHSLRHQQRLPPQSPGGRASGLVRQNFPQLRLSRLCGGDHCARCFVFP